MLDILHVFSRKPQNMRVLLYERVRDEFMGNYVCSWCRQSFSTEDPAEALRKFELHKWEENAVSKKCAA